MFLAVIASILALYLKRTVDQERKQDKIEEVRWSEEEVLSDGVYQYDAKSHTFSRCDKQPELIYKQAEERTNAMDLNPRFAMTDSKQEYNATLPNQTHEPMKHKGH